MLPSVTGTTQQYLADLERNQLQLQRAETEISSGLQVQQPSDDPTAIAEISQTQAAIAQNTQIQSNLGEVTTEANRADSVLQTAVQALENAISLAAEGATSTATPESQAALAQQISGLQQTLVGISQTTVNGRYIFSGDQDTQPAYQLDSSQPNGVQQLLNAPATRVIQSVDGTSIAVAKTASEIFDAPGANNVFAAINSLLTALNTNDQTGITNASDALKSASTYLNGQLAFYGSVENRLQEATGLAQKFQTQQQTQLSQLQDADIPTVATQLTQLQVEQQASMSVESNIAQMKNLFNYLA
jgi:flagellar hook-associated protein 3 FlgL